MSGQLLSHGGLFSGIGGFALGFERAGITSRWEVEIDPACRRVLAARMPEATLYEDVREVGAHNLERVDVITFGSPCQGFSVAGHRGGMEDARSGLFSEAVRIIAELRPRMAVWENVPGVLTTAGGDDFMAAIEALQSCGYVCDADIKDAQEFGVAQRRRRVFVICVRSDVLLQKRTISSDPIVMDLTAQNLLALWDDLLQALLTEQLPLGFARATDGCRASPQRRMRAFENMLGKSPLQALLNYWGTDEPLAECLAAWTDLACALHLELPMALSTAADTSTTPPLTPVGSAAGSLNTWPLLKPRSDGLSVMEKSFIISTSARPITNQSICTSARTMLNIVSSILPSIVWSGHSWSAASSLSTLLKEVTSYARQSTNGLFTEPALRDSWRDCFYRASNLSAEFERRVRGDGLTEILFESSSLRGDIAPRREAWTGVAALTARGVGTCGADDNQSQAGHLIPTITHALCAEGHDASEDGTGRGTPLIALPFDLTQLTSPLNRVRIEPGRPAPTLHQAGGAHVAIRTANTGANGQAIAEEVAHTLDGAQGQAVAFVIKGAAIGREPENGPQYGEILSDGSCYTLNCTEQHAIAFTCKDSGQDAGEIAPTLRAMPHAASHANGGGQVAVAFTQSVESARYNGREERNVRADATQARSREILRIVRQSIGEEATTEWGLGVVTALRASEVLQSGVYGAGVRPASRGPELGVEALRGATPDTNRFVLEVWSAECLRRASQEWRLDGQLVDELGAYLSLLSYQGASRTQALCDLWEAAEGLGVLQSALHSIQEIWRPAGVHDSTSGDVQGVRSASARSSTLCQASSQSGTGETTGDVATSYDKREGVAGFAVRRLTPL